MPIIVHQKKTLAFVLDLEAAARVLKFAERARDLIERNSQLGCQRDNSDGVVNVVPPGNIQERLTQLFAAAIDTKDGREILQLDIRAAIIGLFRNSIGP